jgi:hypothetical protein
MALTAEEFGSSGVVNRSMPPPSITRILHFIGIRVYVPMIDDRVEPLTS